jgi:hypothetical protein
MTKEEILEKHSSIKVTQIKNATTYNFGKPTLLIFALLMVGCNQITIEQEIVSSYEWNLRVKKPCLMTTIYIDKSNIIKPTGILKKWRDDIEASPDTICQQRLREANNYVIMIKNKTCK